MKQLCIALLTLLLGALSPAQEWGHYGATPGGSKYSSADQIDASNVGDLRELWRWDSSDAELAREKRVSKGKVNQSTPLVVDGVLYYHSPLNQVFALDAATGRELWAFDSEAWRNFGDGTPNARGLAYAEVDGEGRLFLGTADDKLISLEATSGRPVITFGDGGWVDLTTGLRRRFAAEHYAVRSPPIVCDGVVIVGSAIRDGVSDWGNEEEKLPPPGDVRGFDARTGKQLWVFHTVPMAGELGYKTWAPGTAEKAGAANVWTTMSADPELGYVYLPISTPSNDHYGGERLGANLFGDSLVCLEARSGRRVWHYQMVHHGLWDYDPPAAPVLADVVVDGVPRKVVVQITKQAFAFVLDRITGEPIWPIVERPVPQSTVAGEESAPTQPFPTWPLPFDRQGLGPDDIVDFTPGIRERTLKMLESFDYGPLFTPPSVRGTIVVPGLAGGGDWSGAALDPESGVLYIPSHTHPCLLTLEQIEEGAPYAYGGHFSFGITGPDGLPLTKPPYGRVTAVDLNTGEHLWMSPVGRGPNNHPLLRDMDLGPLGWDRRAFAVATKTLLLVAAQGDGSLRGGPVKMEELDPFLWAYDPKNGKLLAEIELPHNVQGGFITYEQNGRQYVVLPIGGDYRTAGLIALGLP